MASRYTNSRRTTREFIREIYFHIQGGNQLLLKRADEATTRKLCTNGEVYHTVHCAENTTVRAQRSVGFEDVVHLKKSLKDFMKGKEVQLLGGSSTIRLEARFGHLLFNPSTCTPGPLTTESLKLDKVKKRFVVNGLQTLDNLKLLTSENYDGKASPDAVIFKVRFSEAFGDNRSKWKGICYVKECGGHFTLESTHNGKHYGANVFRIDISRPGKTYDIRLAASVYEDKDSEDNPGLKEVAEEITRSMKRSSSGEFRMQLVGETWNVDYIRENRKVEHKWKDFPKWTLVDCDVCESTQTSQTLKILRRDQQFCDIPISYNTEHKEIELWSNIHEEPKTDSEKWITDVSAGADNFEEFVGACFDIVNKLEP